MNRLKPTSKAFVVLLSLVAAGVLLAGGSRTWVTGTVDDAVLGASRITGSGGEVASGVVALALVAAAAALASTTSGPLVRRITLAVLALAGLAESGLAAMVLLDPSGALGSVAARSTGRTGTVETHASVTAWPWLALVAGLLAVVASAGGWVGARGWRGLSARYETPGATSTGARGQRVASDWDRLDAGDDPTGEAPDPTGEAPDPTGEARDPTG